MKNIVLLVICLLLGGLVIYLQPHQVSNVVPVYTTLAPVPTPDPITSEGVFNAINKYRVRRDLPLFTKSETACEFAEERLPEVQKDFSHAGFVEKAKIYSDTLQREVRFAENLAKDYPSNTKVLDSWETSLLHLTNLKTSLPYLCVATDGNVVVAIWSKI